LPFSAVTDRIDILGKARATELSQSKLDKVDAVMSSGYRRVRRNDGFASVLSSSHIVEELGDDIAEIQPLLPPRISSA
jgi:hypothetical protein